MRIQRMHLPLQLLVSTTGSHSRPSLSDGRRWDRLQAQLFLEHTGNLSGPGHGGRGHQKPLWVQQRQAGNRACYRFSGLGCGGTGVHQILQVELWKHQLPGGSPGSAVVALTGRLFRPRTTPRFYLHCRQSQRSGAALGSTEAGKLLQVIG